MKINRDNYEAYFLDYHEGQLSLEMMEEVDLFVTLNPDLKNILEEFEPITLVPANEEVFDRKSALKKNQVFATTHLNELNYEEYLLSEAEGLLNDEQLSAIDEFISINPQFEKDRRLFSLAHLTVDNNIVFEAKETLKKKAIPVGPIDAETYETFMAREIDGDLNAGEKLQMAEFMQYNPHLEKDHKLFAQTILSTETNIVFEAKNSLKHVAIIPMRRVVYSALSAAASIALLFSMYFLLDRNNIPHSVAEHTKVKNIVNQTIAEPTPLISDEETALNNSLNGGSTNNPDQIVSDVASTTASNHMKDNTLAHGAMPSVNKRPLETMPARQANEITTRSYVDPQFTFIRESQMYMNENLEFYYNLKLAQELDYTAMNAKDNNPAKTIFRSLTGKIGDALAFNRNEPAKAEKKDFSLWTVAELGVKTFNTITSSDLELNLKKDDEGKVVGYGLESNIIDINRDLKK